MQFDPDNKVVKLCAEGMSMEGAGKKAEASRLFLQALADATDDFEKFTAAHYVARHQQSLVEKLAWDVKALNFALKMDSESMRGFYPSLYLNIAKGHEDLGDYREAEKYYRLAGSYLEFLGESGYGAMIRRGIGEGTERVKQMLAKEKEALESGE